MPDKDPSGEFFPNELQDPTIREVARDFDLLGYENRFDIEQFDGLATEYKELALTPTACLLEADDARVLPYRTRMLQQLGIPTEGTARLETDTGWKRYSDCIIRTFLIRREGGDPPVPVRVSYELEPATVSHVYLMGPTEAKRWKLKLGKSATHENIDQRLRNELGLSTAEIDAMDDAAVPYDLRKQALSDLGLLRSDKTFASTDPINKKEISRRRRQVARAFFPLRGQIRMDAVNDAVEHYRGYLKEHLETDQHVDRFTQADIFRTEQSKRLELYNTKLVNLRLRRNSVVAASGALTWALTSKATHMFLEYAAKGMIAPETSVVASITSGTVIAFSAFRMVPESRNPSIKASEVPPAKTVKEQIESERKLIVRRKERIRKTPVLSAPVRKALFKLMELRAN